MRKNKRVFIGLTNTAGVCSRLKRGFNEIGIIADFYSFDVHVYNYIHDKLINFSSNSIIRKLQKIFLMIKLIIRYDYFIYVTPGSLLKDYKDIKILKKLGKKTMMVFTGCDARMPEKVMDFKWNPCRECTQEYKNFVGCNIDNKKYSLPYIESVFDIIGCPIEAGGYLKKKWFNAIFPIDFTAFPKSSPKKYTPNSKLKILHAPSNQVYKGSKYIFKTVEELKLNYDFEFKVVNNLSIDMLYKEMADSDLIIDQMLLGSYGFVSIEAMAMYRPVICYIREEIWSDLKEHAPIFNANPDTLYKVLEKILLNPTILMEASIKSRKYVEDYWNEKKVARMYFNQFENFSRD